MLLDRSGQGKGKISFLSWGTDIFVKQLKNPIISFVFKIWNVLLKNIIWENKLKKFFYYTNISNK